MKFILGTKEEMTQYFTEDGKAIPVTIIKTAPNTVTAIKTMERDGYSAVQIGFGEQKESRLNKAQIKNGAFKTLKEYRDENIDPDLKVGQILNASELFEEGEKVEVSGTSKGKGFQGVVKRHGFHGGPRTHGQKHSEREPGSIGAGGIQRVLKGTRMAGRMGSDRITNKNMKIVSIDAENNLLLIKGAIPGRRGSLVEIKSK